MANTPAAVRMPKWGLSMEEGKVVHWWRSEGDAVREGEDLVDIETAKINNTMEAPVSGLLRRVVTTIDETVPVGALLAVIADADTPDADIEQFVSEHKVPVVDAADAVADVLQLRHVETSVGRLHLGTTQAEELHEAIVLIHGFAGDLNAWMFNIDALRAAHPVVAIDLPGHGGSFKEPGDASLPALGAGVVEALSAIGVGKAHLVGHSLGAAVAAQVALTAPALVASLTLIAPPVILGGELSREFLDGVVDAQRARDLKTALQMLVSDPALVGNEMVEGVLRSKRLDGAEEWLAALRDRMLDGADLSDLKARLNDLPSALVIVSPQDRIVGKLDEQALPPGWRIAWIDGVGHMPQLERSAEVDALIVSQTKTQ